MIRQLLGYFLGRHRRLETGQDLAIRAHEEFREIPRDVLGTVRRRVPRLEEGIEIASPGTIDFDLRKHGEVDAVGRFRELQDLFVRAGFLLAELIAGKAQDREALILVVIV